MSKHKACTIVSNNYLGFARVFASSFLAYHPEGEVSVLFVDEPDSRIDYDAEPYQVVFAKDLGIPAFRNVAFRYSILELNTAVKPYFLSYLYERKNWESVCYFDPDILVTDNLSELYACVEDSDIVLTPHILEPIGDSCLPNERSFLVSGIYNLGFLGLAFNPDTLRFLDWWKTRLYHECEHNIERGLFVDQRWMDMAPAFLSRTTILRDPGYNVAYWNLMHRRLSRTSDGSYRVGSSPLRFYHFSGLDPRSPDNISKHQNRYQLQDRPDLVPIFDDYVERLEAHNFYTYVSLPYAYGHFSSGVPIPTAARLGLRKIDPNGIRWPNPFDTETPASFYRWLLETAGGSESPHLPRIALHIWDERVDLQHAFPDPAKTNLRGFTTWFVQQAESEADLHAQFVEPARQSLARLREAG